MEYELRFEDDIAKKLNFPAERSNADDISDELYELGQSECAMSGTKLA